MKKTFIKALSVVMVVVMTFTASPLSGFVGLELPEWLDFSIISSAATSGTCGENVTWEFDESTGTLTISGTGAMIDYSNDPYNDYRPWTNHKENIIKAVIGDNVTKIGGGSFAHCENLISITLPDSLKVIGDYAFSCCYSLENLVIPNEVTTVNRYAFNKCTNLISIKIPDCVAEIGEYAFNDCDSLTNITVDNGNQYYSSDEYGVLFNKDKTTLIQYPIGNTRISYEIPDSVRIIGDSAFIDCTNLTNIKIPNSVTTVNAGALYNTGFYNDESNWENGALYFGYNLIDVKEDISGVFSIKMDTKTISYGAFDNCNSLTNIIIPNSVITIGEEAFADCTSLKDIVIPDSVTSIGNYAFTSCENLTEITIPESVSTAGIQLFIGCYNLINLSIYGSLKIIDYEFSFESPNLTNLTLGDKVTSIGEYAFECCEKLENVVIGNGVKKIDDYAFAYCCNLKSVKIGNSVTLIGDGAFECCESLTNIIIPDSVTTIGDFAFDFCESLTSITIPDCVTLIGDGAFDCCESLTDVYYSGTEEQWNEISIGSDNEYLTNATIHYNSVIPSDNEEKSVSDIALGLDRFSLNEDIIIDLYDEISVLMTYTSNYECAETFNITSSNTKVAEIVSVENGSDKFINLTDVNKQSADINLKINNAGTTTITVVASNGASSNIKVVVNGSERGVLESTVWSVILDQSGNNWVSNIKVDGIEYPVNENYSKEINLIDNEDNFISKDVVINLVNGEVVSINTVEEIVNDIQTGINVTLKITPNKVDYTDEEFLFDSIEAQIWVSSTVTSDIMGYDLVLDELDRLAVSNIVLKTDNKRILNFDGKESLSVDVGEVVSAGASVMVAEVPIDVKQSYKMDKDISKENVIISCVVNCDCNGKTIEGSSLAIVNVIDNKNSKPTVSYDTDIQEAVSELQNIVDAGAISLEADITGTLNNLLNSAQRKSIGAMILCQVALRTADEDAFEEYVSKDTWEKISSGVESDTLEFTIETNTSYGIIGIKFTCEYTTYLLSGYKGDLYYEIVNGNDRLPVSFAKSGRAGGLYGANLKSFARVAEKIALDELEEAYSLAWGDDANKAADIIFGKTAKKIISESKYGDFSSLIWKILIAPAKEVMIKCPVNVYVYNSNDELVSAVENNTIILNNENAFITLEGDIKKVLLFDDSYRIEYKSLATYNMEIIVKEYGFSECLLRTVKINDIPLNNGVEFEQNIDDDILNNSDYSLIDDNDNVYTPDSDALEIHNHQFVEEWEHIKDATCTDFGYDVALCSVCNEWCVKVTPELGHSCSEEYVIDIEPTCIVEGMKSQHCSRCDFVQNEIVISATGHSYINNTCQYCGEIAPFNPGEPEYNYTFSVQEPSRREIRNNDGIVLHAKVDGTAPTGSYVKWESSNGNFDEDANGYDLEIIAKNKGCTTFTAILCDADGNELARDSVEMYSKSGFIDKISGFFRGLFGLTKIYEN